MRPEDVVCRGMRCPVACARGRPGPHNVGRVMEYDLEAGGIGPLRRAGRWLNPDTWRGFDRLFGR